MGKGEFKMLEKNKKYTYKELEEIIEKAKLETIENLSKQYQDVAGEDNNPIPQFVFSMQNMLATTKMAKILLGEDK